jgi:peptidoglycan/xylan/chitin deacetylase (PgdA/CDA1 family)
MQFAPLYPVLHRILHPLFPGCLWVGNSTDRTVALTFDDGPHPEYTPQLLQVLDRHEVPVSFFWLGVCVARSPAIARAIFERGHWIGLHGYTHRSFPLLSQTELRQSLTATQEAIAQACGVPVPEIYRQVRDVRPPNGLFTPRILKLLQQWSYRPVMWSVVPEDWVCPGIPVVLQRLRTQTCSGSLIVLHDGVCGGQDVAAIADVLISDLLEQGYRFVTIDQLWQQAEDLNHIH